MMNRMPEKIISWIAIGISAIYFIILLISYLFMNNAPQFKASLKSSNQLGANADQTMAQTQMAMPVLLGILGSVVILGIIATLIMKKKRVLSICLFFVIALLVFFTMNLLSTLLWVVVAIMLIVRNDKKHTTHQNQQFTNKEQDLNHQHQQKKENDPYIY